jgi:hypothetical protein
MDAYLEAAIAAQPAQPLPILDEEFFRRSPWAASQRARHGVLTEGDPLQIASRRLWLAICQDAGLPYIPLYVDDTPGCINAGYYETPTEMGLAGNRSILVGLDLARCTQDEDTLGLVEASLYHEAGHYAESFSPEAMLRRRRVARLEATPEAASRRLREGAGPAAVAVGLALMLRHPLEVVRQLGERGIRAYASFCVAREKRRNELQADDFAISHHPELADELGAVLGLNEPDLAHRLERIAQADNPLDRARLRLGYLLIDSVHSLGVALRGVPSDPEAAADATHPPSLRRLQQLSRKARGYGVRTDLLQMAQALDVRSRRLDAVETQGHSTWLQSIGY